MKNFATAIILIVILPLITSCSASEKDIVNSDIEVIDIKSSLDNYAIVKLSDYASDIKYIPLETNDSVLISGISQLIYERETIYILDHSDKILLFDKGGKYLRTFIRKGRGPGEYVDPFSFRVNPDNGDIYVLDAWRGILRYDKDFNFIKIYPLPGDGLTALMFEITGDDQVSASIADLINSKHSIVTYGKDTSDVIFRKEAQYDFDPRKRENLTFLYHSLYLVGGKLRYYHHYNDTIYTLTNNYNSKALYFIDFGGYREQPQISANDYGSYDADIITPMLYRESDKLVFMSFIMRGFCREPIATTSFDKDGKEVDYYSTFDYAIYDKQKGEVKFLLHSVKDHQGFKEDILGGMPFWLSYISSNQHLVMYEEVSHTLDYLSEYPPQSRELKELSEIINEESNPVVIIATLK
jgi:hypothetical protein